MSPTRGYAKVMAARKRLALAEARRKAAEEGYETEERYEAAQARQDAAAAIDSMVDDDIERALLGD